ncbi:hypothetical protein Tsubulata_050583 [Turnera subulata]|uniref:Cystatin domain-containing protein n=1 Tax=Turnera subulata TaxID=218843 RepID=A0A9Q0FRM5_9ROSI|nr:hypothetical protein Tsubulata_050583 [Turnera subulata]
MGAPEVYRKRKLDSIIDDDDDDDEDLSGTEEDDRYDYRNAIDGVVVDDGLVPLRDDVPPDWNTKYVPVKVKKVYDLYRESVNRSAAFDCDGYYYSKLPPHVRVGRTHPIKITDPDHAPRLQTCAHYAIATYNEKKGAMLRLEAIEKVNVVPFNGLNHVNYFMTLKVKDESTIPAESKISLAIVGYLGYPGKPLRLLTSVYDLENNTPPVLDSTEGWIGGSHILGNL